MTSVKIVNADARTGLTSLSDASVDCCVTSPPYWGLRDYGIPGQIGLERTLGEHIGALVSIFREVKRILRPSGTLWLNYGDMYASTVNGRSAAETRAAGSDNRTFRDKPFSTAVGGLKQKDLCMAPHRLAIALQDDGWWVRSDIVWSKPNPMPESCKDRPTRAHEYIFLMAKSEKYYYDASAISEPAVTKDGKSWTDKGRDKQRGHSRRHAGFNGRYADSIAKYGPPQTRNARSVWEITPEPFPDAHFATFPRELSRRCILAGCPEGGLVLDPFAGSGTVGLVAQQTGRNAVLIELNADYCEIARRRLAADAPLLTWPATAPTLATAL